MAKGFGKTVPGRSYKIKQMLEHNTHTVHKYFLKDVSFVPLTFLVVWLQRSRLKAVYFKVRCWENKRPTQSSSFSCERLWTEAVVIRGFLQLRSTWFVSRSTGLFVDANSKTQTHPTVFLYYTSTIPQGLSCYSTQIGLFYPSEKTMCLIRLNYDIHIAALYIVGMTVFENLLSSPSSQNFRVAIHDNVHIRLFCWYLTDITDASQ